MNDLDKLIRNAKPQAPDLPEGFTSKVMTAITQLDHSPTPASTQTPKARLHFVIGVIGLVIATVLFNYNTYEIRMNGSLELLFFGSQYLVDFVRYLPLDLIIPAAMLSLISAWQIRKSGIINRSIASLMVFSILITGGGGSALAAIGLNNQLESTLSQNEDTWSWLKIFQHSRARQFIQHPHMRLGIVERVINGKAELATPNGERLMIHLPPGTEVKIGQYLRTSGIDNPTFFSAQKVHFCNPNRVNRYFGKKKRHKMMKRRKMKRSCCN